MIKEWCANCIGNDLDDETIPDIQIAPRRRPIGEFVPWAEEEQSTRESRERQRASLSEKPEPYLFTGSRLDPEKLARVFSIKVGIYSPFKKYMEPKGGIISEWPHNVEMVGSGLVNYRAFECPVCGYLCKVQECKIRYASQLKADLPSVMAFSVCWSSRYSSYWLRQLIKEGNIRVNRADQSCSAIGWPWQIQVRRYKFLGCPACDCPAWDWAAGHWDWELEDEPI